MYRWTSYLVFIHLGLLACKVGIIPVLPISECLGRTAERLYIEAHSQLLRASYISHTIQGPAWVLLHPGNPPTFQSSRHWTLLAFPATLFISALTTFALVLLLKYFRFRNIFPPQSLAQRHKHSSVPHCQCHEWTGGAESGTLPSWICGAHFHRKLWKKLSYGV